MKTLALLFCLLPVLAFADPFDPAVGPKWTNAGAMDYASTAVGSAGAAVTKTISAAGAGLHIVVEGFDWSLSDVPGAAVTLTISDGSTVMRKYYITGGGPSGPLKLPRPLRGSANTAMTATISAPGGSIIATVSLDVRVE